MEQRLLPERSLRDWQAQIMRDGGPPKRMVEFDGYKAVIRNPKESLIKKIRNRAARRRLRKEWH